jgi:hypothetical protein
VIANIPLASPGQDTGQFQLGVLVPMKGKVRCHSLKEAKGLLIGSGNLLQGRFHGLFLTLIGAFTTKYVNIVRIFDLKARSTAGNAAL